MSFNKYKFLFVIVSVIVSLYLAIHYFYQSKEINSIKKIQRLVVIERMSESSGDSGTLNLIKEAKSDSKVTNGEFNAIKESFTEFKPLRKDHLKSPEEREKEFMERKARHLAENENNQPH